MDLEMDPDLDLTPTWSKVRHIWDCSQRWSGLSKSTTQIWIWRWIQIQSWPPTWSKVRHIWDCSQRWSGLSKSTTQIWIWRWIQIWTWPPHDLRWDIYGTAARDGVDSQKLQPKYGSGDGSRSIVDPPHDLRWDIYGTAARDGVDSQKLQLKYGSGDGSRSGVDPHTLTLSKVKHRWDWNQRWSGPYSIPIYLYSANWVLYHIKVCLPSTELYKVIFA